MEPVASAISARDVVGILDWYLSAAARRAYERVRGMLGAVAAPAVLPLPPAPACPCCGYPMTFVRCLRPARAPPSVIPPPP